MNYWRCRNAYSHTLSTEHSAKGTAIMARSSGSTRRGSRRRAASGSRPSSGGREAGSRVRGGAKSRASSTGTHSRHVTNVTTEHEMIRRWAEERGAKPARVQGTGGNDDIGI